jgi:hypothetical protein
MAGTAGTGTGGSGSVGISSVPPRPPAQVDAAPAPTPAVDAALPAPMPDAAPVSPPPPPPPPDAAPTTGPDPFCPATPDLAACLRFESRLQDDSPNHLMVEGSARYAPGVSGQAMDPGPNSRVSIPESPQLDSAAITVEAWVNARELGRRMDIVNNAGQYSMVVLASGSVMCSGRGGYALRTATVTPGRWIHLACVYEAATTTLWVDGQMVLQRPAGPVATESLQGVRIGWGEEPNTHFDGLIDSLRIWRVARRPDATR